MAMDRWDVPALFDLVRRAYPYRDLTPTAFESVLKMVSGRFPTEHVPRPPRPGELGPRPQPPAPPCPARPGSRWSAAGRSPTPASIPVYLGEDGPRLGELDEEFVLERRVGETFVLGTVDLADRGDRAPPRGRRPRRGAVGDDALLARRGVARGRPSWARRSARSAARSPRGSTTRRSSTGSRAECRLEPPPRESLRDHVARQVRVAGAVPDDRTVLVETFRDPAGEIGLAVLTPFGGKLHQALEAGASRPGSAQRLGITVALPPRRRRPL